MENKWEIEAMNDTYDARYLIEKWQILPTLDFEEIDEMVNALSLSI